MFLTAGALFILVVDIHAYSVKHSREDALDLWLDILQSRVPGSVVLLVGTHSDLFGANPAECIERTDGFKRGRPRGRTVTVVMYSFPFFSLSHSTSTSSISAGEFRSGVT